MDDVDRTASSVHASIDDHLVRSILDSIVAAQARMNHARRNVETWVSQRNDSLTEHLSGLVKVAEVWFEIGEAYIETLKAACGAKVK